MSILMNSLMAKNGSKVERFWVERFWVESRFFYI
jgi:hypothetical protein